MPISIPRPTLPRLRAGGRAVLAAIAAPLDLTDPLVDLQRATRAHRRQHRCGAYTYGDASLPATLAAAVAAERIIEVGTAIGYTAASMATAAPDAHVETIEMDDEHVRLARGHLADRGLGDRVTVLHGTAETILPVLAAGAYDLAFFDGFTPSIDVIRELHRLLRPGGLLIAGNLILGPSKAVVDHLSDPRRWQTHSMGETALCLKK